MIFLFHNNDCINWDYYLQDEFNDDLEKIICI